MATIHAGDCLSGCDTCATNYHEALFHPLNFSSSLEYGDTCDTCGELILAADDPIPYTLTDKGVSAAR